MKSGDMAINQQWGVKQADKYIDGLHVALSDVADNIDDVKVRDVPMKLMLPVKFIHHYGRHYLFFREASSNVPEKIQVLTILHDSMDIPQRLVEALRCL